MILRNRPAVHPDHCFVLMPFAAEFENVFEVVRRAAEYCGLTCTRADMLTTTGQITDDIWNSIMDARVLVADLTGNNPNVFYETGVAHALGKPVILLTQEGSRVPFDLRVVRHISYDPKALRELAESLLRVIRTSLEIRIPQIEGLSFNDSGPPNVRLTGIKMPGVVTQDQPIHIEIRARNYGGPADQAYFSASFPFGFDRVKVLHFDCETKIGLRNDGWANKRIVLRYPIVEGFSYHNPLWAPRVEHYIIVEARATREGLLQVYFNSSSQTDPLPFTYDPTPTDSPLRDQRDEPVYCGVIQVLNSWA